MHVGKGIFFQSLDDPAGDADVYVNELAMAEEAEGQGFGSLWAAEHHFAGYHMCPNPVQLLSYLAARTSQVRLGSMVVVLPWHDPVRVAEELIVADHYSRGRLVVGFGRGLGRIEFEGLRVEMGESRERFVEYAEALVDAFETGVMKYEGEHYQQPPVVLRPAPLTSLRGRIYASAVSPQSMEIMARLGFGIMVIAQKPWETTEAEVAAYRERYLEINGVAPPQPLLVSLVGVDESAERAREIHERYIQSYYKAVVEHYEFGNLAMADIPGYEYYGKLAQNISKHGVGRYAEFLADLQVHGTPEECVEQLATNVRRLDGAGVIAITSYGGMPFEQARAHQQLFAERVMPALQALDTDRELAPLGGVAGSLA